jgi:hypothetical protein
MVEHPSSSPTALYGCMGLGGTWDTMEYGAAEIDRAAAALEAALDSGFTWFDHADIYGRGKAEAVFGEVLARQPGLREEIVIQTSAASACLGHDQGGAGGSITTFRSTNRTPTPCPRGDGLAQLLEGVRAPPTGRGDSRGLREMASPA